VTAEQERDGEAAGDMASAAHLELHDVVDDGHEDDGEERADVDQEEDIAQAPCQQRGQHDAEGEEDVAANSGTAFCSVWVGEGGRGYS
jgi:hypothetical protein